MRPGKSEYDCGIISYIIVPAMSLADDEAKIEPYGSWKSPLSSKVVSGSSISFQDLRVDPKNPGNHIVLYVMVSYPGCIPSKLHAQGAPWKKFGVLKNLFS